MGKSAINRLGWADVSRVIWITRWISRMTCICNILNFIYSIFKCVPCTSSWYYVAWPWRGCVSKQTIVNSMSNKSCVQQNWRNGSAGLQTNAVEITMGEHIFTVISTMITKCGYNQLHYAIIARIVQAKHWTTYIHNCWL